MSDQRSIQSVVPIEKVDPRPGKNPNVMPEELYRLLVRGIARYGCLQPLLVRAKPKGRYETIDGHHRLRACLEVGLREVPVVVTKADDAVAAASTLSLNRLRGEIDLTTASDILRDLAKQGFDDLTLSGFSDIEVASLLADVGSGAADVLDDLGAGAGSAGTTKDSATQRYALRLVFDSEDSRDSVRDQLLARGPTAEAGILSVLGVS